MTEVQIATIRNGTAGRIEMRPSLDSAAVAIIGGLGLEGIDLITIEHQDSKGTSSEFAYDCTQPETLSTAVGKITEALREQGTEVRHAQAESAAPKISPKRHHYLGLTTFRKLFGSAS
jgi:hypothetical protein